MEPITHPSYGASYSAVPEVPSATRELIGRSVLRWRNVEVCSHTPCALHGSGNDSQQRLHE